MAAGDYGSPVKPWRGGGNPMDIATVDAKPRQSAGQGLWKELPPSPWAGGAGAALWLWSRRPKDSWIAAWSWCFGFFLVLMLGPWLKLFGAHLYLPLLFTSFIFFPCSLIFPTAFISTSPRLCSWRYSWPSRSRSSSPRKGAPWRWRRGALGLESWHGTTPLYEFNVPSVGRKPARSAGGRSLAGADLGHVPLTCPTAIWREFFNNMMAQVINQKPAVEGRSRARPGHLRFFT